MIGWLVLARLGEEARMMSKGRLRIAMALVGAMLLPVVPADAQAFTYDESIQGDLDWVYEYPAVFDLGPGENVISGSRTATNNTDKDIFGFTVPEGHVLRFISIEFEITEDTRSLHFFGFSFDLRT